VAIECNGPFDIRANFSGRPRLAEQEIRRRARNRNWRLIRLRQTPIAATINPPTGSL
jgi:hypothetical protein